MEPTNHPFIKENHLPNLHEDMFHVNLPGVYLQSPCFVVSSGDCVVHFEVRELCLDPEVPLERVGGGDACEVPCQGRSNSSCFTIHTPQINRSFRAK